MRQLAPVIGLLTLFLLRPSQAASLWSWAGLEKAPVPPLDVLDVPIAQAPAVSAYAQALDLIEAGRFTEAVSPLTQAIEGDEENGDFLLARGVALLLSEKVPEGQKDLERAHRLRPNDTDTRRMLAFALRLQGDELNAPKYYSHASTDPYDEFLLKTGNDYGAITRAAGVPSQQYQQETRQRHQRALSQFSQIGQQFARLHKKGQTVGRALFGRGIERFKRGEFAGAEQDFLSVLQEFPDDYTSLYYHAAALIQENRLEQGRQEMSTVLSWKPALTEGYCQRAIAAAKMGDLARAEHDLGIAARLDPKDSRRSRAPAEKVFSEAKGAEPRAPAAKLYEELLNGARAKEPSLLARAEQLMLAANAHRTNGDEVYQERRRELAWAVATDPRNPDKLASLGNFLRDEADIRGECVEPNGQWIRYRAQSERLQNNELAYARELFNDALKANPKHVPSLVGLAALEIRNLQWANAENILRRAMQIREDVPEMLELMSRIMQQAADQRSAKAANLREVKTWTEYGFDVIWHYTRYPSLAERDRADEFDRQADQFMDSSKQYFQRALKACAGTAQGFYYQGVIAWKEGRWEDSRKAMEQAAKLAPDDRRVHYTLANAYAKLNLVDASLEQDTIARNLEHTSAAPWLQRAWSKIVNNAWKTSQAALDKALQADPADPRIPAYFGTIAEAQEHTDDAIAFYRAALAIEEARARQRGTTYGGGSGVWPVNDFGHALILRIRLGQLIQRQSPAEAAALYLQNVALEDRVTEWGFSSRIQTAMLPDPQQDLKIAPTPPIAAAVLRKNRALAGIALTRAGQFKEAIVQFEQLGGYEARLRGGGTAYLDWGDDLAKAPGTFLAAAEAYDGAGQPLRAYQWLLKAKQHYQGNWQGPKDPQSAEYTRVKEKIETELCSAYKASFDQAVSAIKATAPTEREPVRAQWEQKLRPIYTSGEICFREHQIEPPWQTLSAYVLFQQSGLFDAQAYEQSFEPQRQKQLEESRKLQEKWKQERKVDDEFQSWLRQEMRRIQKLPPNEQHAATVELQDKIKEHRAAQE